jgi:hypothetical protein
MSDLDDALADLSRSLENFAEAYVASVARMLAKEMDAARARAGLTKRGPRPCPTIDVHERHTWRFPDSNMSDECPGIAQERQCLDNLAHCGPHTWHLDPKTVNRVLAGASGMLQHTCPGLEHDREVLRCPFTPGAHPAHLWGPEGSGPLAFCTGRTKAQMKAANPVTCYLITSHDPHDGCDGKGLGHVPAGPDRFA